MNTKTGIELIAEERQEHFTKHKRTIEGDVLDNPYYELRNSARALMATHPSNADIPEGWKSSIMYHAVNKPYKERLIIAGSLIAAEIDRLQYLENELETGIITDP